MNILNLSGNTKLGKIPATTLPITTTCPTSCMHHPQRAATCYAYQGYVRPFQQRLAAAYPVAGHAAAVEVAAVATLPAGSLLRLHVAGEWVNISHVKRVASVVRRLKLRAWTYTHKWRTLAASAFAGISVLASCETMADVKQAWQCGYAPALIVPKFQSRKAYDLGDGFTGIPCPAPARTTCDKCKLCLKGEWLKETKRVILFEAHGSGAKKLRTTLVQIGGVK